MGDHRHPASSLNGSDNLLGKAMRRVIEESMAPMEERLNERIDGVKDELKTNIAKVRGEEAPGSP